MSTVILTTEQITSDAFGENGKVIIRVYSADDWATAGIVSLQIKSIFPDEDTVWYDEGVQWEGDAANQPPAPQTVYLQEGRLYRLVATSANFKAEVGGVTEDMNEVEID